MKYITLLFIFLVHFSFSQSVGFFGKKNVISLNGIGAMPIIQNFFHGEFSEFPYYKNVNGKLKASRDFFNGGFSAGFSHTFSNKFGLGFDFETFFSNAAGPSSGNYNIFDPNFGGTYEQYVEFKHEALKLRTFTFMPKIEFQLNNNQLPIGIVNQFGIGFTTTKIEDKKYGFDLVYTYDEYMSNELNSSRVFDKTIVYNGITIMYAFNVRVPITKSLLFNYGIRYNFNYNFGLLGANGGGFFNDNYEQNSNYLVKDYQMKSEIGSARLVNIITLNLGFCFVI